MIDFPVKFRDNRGVTDNKPGPEPEQPDDRGDEPEDLDIQDSDPERDKWKGHTTEHAKPARLEDEGQSGG